MQWLLAWMSDNVWLRSLLSLDWWEQTEVECFFKMPITWFNILLLLLFWCVRHWMNWGGSLVTRMVFHSALCGWKPANFMTFHIWYGRPQLLLFTGNIMESSLITYLKGAICHWPLDVPRCKSELSLQPDMFNVLIFLHDIKEEIAGSSVFLSSPTALENLRLCYRNFLS